MATVKFFGEARTKLAVAEVTLDATSVKTLIAAIAQAYPIIDEKTLKNFLIYVNGTPINKLNMFRTKLVPNDEILFLSPTSGG